MQTRLYQLEQTDGNYLQDANNTHASRSKIEAERRCIRIVASDGYHNGSRPNDAIRRVAGFQLFDSHCREAATIAFLCKLSRWG
jgi:hypothetical protein